MKPILKQFLKQFLTAVLLVSVLLTGSAASAGISCGGTALAAENKEPSIKAKTAIVYCATTGEVVWEKNADKQMNPASMTKLMTCLLAIENLDLDHEVEVTKKATEVIPSKIYLQEGEKVTVRDLLYAALLESANDAATALAIETAGSVKKFAKMMNARAAAIGCTGTNFVTPSGLAADGHVSTARDIAQISAEAFGNKTLREIAGTDEYTIPATNKSEERKLENGNLLLKGGTLQLPSGTVTVKKYKGVFGGKTGTTEEQVATMTAGLDCDGLELYAVVMGTTLEKRYSDICKLLNYGKENVSKYVVFEKGAEFDEAKLKGGATNRVKAAAAEPGYINLPEGASASLITTKTAYEEDLKAPVKKGQKVGTVEIYLADEKVREIDLLAAESIRTGWFLSRFGITNFQTVVLCVMLVLILAFLTGIFTMRAINRKKKQRRRQQKIMEAARRELEREQSMKQRGWPY